MPTGRMPFTFLAHQAPVLPLLLWRPRWFDGVALCVGSMIPDFAYVAAGTGWGFVSHSAWGLAWFCVPVAVVVSVVVRAVTPTVLAHAPGRWRDRGARLFGPTPGWWRMWTSALVGAGSHVLIDAFTHRRGFGVALCPALRRAPIAVWGAPVPVYKLLQIPGSLVLAVIAVVCLRALVRRGGAGVAVPSASAASRRWFVAVASAVAVLAVAIAWWTRAYGGAPAFLLRMVTVTGVGVVAAALLAGRHMRR